MALYSHYEIYVKKVHQPNPWSVDANIHRVRSPNTPFEINFTIFIIAISFNVKNSNNNKQTNKREKKTKL